jgi:transposase
MTPKIKATHEQVADIPVIIARLKKMRVAELLDEHFPTNSNWTGLSLGWVTVVWLTFIISEGDHRLSHLEPWVREHQRTLWRCLGKKVAPRDCTDDRLATVLDYLCLILQREMYRRLSSLRSPRRSKTVGVTRFPAIFAPKKPPQTRPSTVHFSL